MILGVQPVVNMWVHVDDSLMHGGHLGEDGSGIEALFGHGRGRWLCHPKKLTPPTQVVKVLWVPYGLSGYSLPSHPSSWQVRGGSGYCGALDCSPGGLDFLET